MRNTVPTIPSIVAICFMAFVPKSNAQPIAVSFQEIWDYGIVTAYPRNDTAGLPVCLYASPYDSTVVDTLMSGSAVKYRRLSVIDRVPAIKLLLGGKNTGEWFFIETPKGEGWLPDQNLMTLLGADWGRDPTRVCKSFCGGHAIALYTAGQFWTSSAMSAAYWQRIRGDEVWVLRDVLMDVLSTGLYVGASLDSIVCTKSDTLIFVRSIGGDGGDIWGEQATCTLTNGKLEVIHRECIFETSDE